MLVVAKFLTRYDLGRMWVTSRHLHELSSHVDDLARVHLKVQKVVVYDEAALKLGIHWVEARGFLLDGERHGDWRFYRPGGQLIRRGFFFRGLPHGKHVEFEPGNCTLCHVGHYFYGERVGFWVTTRHREGRFRRAPTMWRFYGADPLKRRIRGCRLPFGFVLALILDTVAKSGP
jgi:hypothetical protein